MIKLGLSFRHLGYHSAAWRHPRYPDSGTMDINNYIKTAQMSEAGLIDFLFLADGLAVHQEDRPPGSLCCSDKAFDLEPLTLLSALAMTTKQVGLVATASTTYNEPFQVARKFASLDHISGGRAGWNIVTSWSKKEAQNFSRESHLEYELRYDRATEFVEVTKGLWNSWDEDAIIRDKATGQFYDPSKLHALNHKGKHFSVAGPLTMARCPQGRPLLVQAGQSEEGKDLAAATADVVFTVQSGIEGAIQYYSSLKGRLAKYGRTEDEVLVMPGLLPIVGKTDAEAQAKHKELQELLHPLAGLNLLYGILGDLSDYPLDGPVPEPKDPALRSRADVLIKMARRENLTIRQLYKWFSSGRGHYVFVGTAERLADVMQEWLEKRAADGFNITPAYLPGGLEDLVELVIPELQRRGLYKKAYEGSTLRERLGLPKLSA
jgi:alkanesulfonate monooxygenase